VLEQPEQEEEEEEEEEGQDGTRQQSAPSLQLVRPASHQHSSCMCCCWVVVG
jgi:hypothetical protein